MVFVRVGFRFSFLAQVNANVTFCVVRSGLGKILQVPLLTVFCVFWGVRLSVKVQKAFRIDPWDATVAKLVDAIGLGPIGRNAVLVRVQSVAPPMG